VSRLEGLLALRSVLSTAVGVLDLVAIDQRGMDSPDLLEDISQGRILPPACLLCMSGYIWRSLHRQNPLAVCNGHASNVSWLKGISAYLSLLAPLSLLFQFLRL
jgi:hypothetical protein